MTQADPEAAGLFRGSALPLAVFLPSWSGLAAAPVDWVGCGVECALPPPRACFRVLTIKPLARSEPWWSLVTCCSPFSRTVPPGWLPVDQHQELGRPAPAQGAPAPQVGSAFLPAAMQIRSPRGLSRSLRSLLRTAVLLRHLMKTKCD